ncbi:MULTISPECIES: DUF4139 domain-containing protein [Thioclava]|uniref:DUF4139 domain-containing protein n=1 Tax=Thioclava kandeliae TaxID=3070818 RepID=A0ABV1SFZ4_9RHOB
MRLMMAGMVVALPQAVWAQDVLYGKVSAVTLYPQGAEVVRQVRIPQGAGQVVIAGLPQSMTLDRLSISADQARLSGVRLVAGNGADSPALGEARVRVTQLTEALAQKEDGVKLLQAEAEAALDRVAYLRGLNPQGDAQQALDLGEQIEARALVARRNAVEAQARARQAEAALDPDRRALAEARADLSDLEAKSQTEKHLEATATGEGVLTLTSFVEDAGWAPVYDMRLDREAKQIDLTRLVSVHQSSGEDWSGVDLTLSTARPNDRMDPTELWPDLRQIGTEGPVLRSMGAAAPMAESAAMLKSDQLDPQMEGVSLVYHLPEAVDIRDGAEALRLRMQDERLASDIWAEAVPSRDETAYLVAEATNNGEEPILPGRATLYVDGALVGQSDLPMTMPGEKITTGFGALDGVTLSNDVTRQTGDRGVISRRNAREEITRMTVENHTGQDWPLRVVGQVPYSEQDDLKIDWTAEPAPSETDLDDRTGVLGWRFDLPAKASREITVTTRFEWPEDQVLR